MPSAQVLSPEEHTGSSVWSRVVTSAPLNNRCIVSGDDNGTTTASGRRDREEGVAAASSLDNKRLETFVKSFMRKKSIVFALTESPLVIPIPLLLLSSASEEEAFKSEIADDNIADGNGSDTKFAPRVPSAFLADLKAMGIVSKEEKEAYEAGGSEEEKEKEREEEGITVPSLLHPRGYYTTATFDAKLDPRPPLDADKKSIITDIKNDRTYGTNSGSNHDSKEGSPPFFIPYLLVTLGGTVSSEGEECSATVPLLIRLLTTVLKYIVMRSESPKTAVGDPNRAFLGAQPHAHAVMASLVAFARILYVDYSVSIHSMTDVNVHGNSVETPPSAHPLEAADIDSWSPVLMASLFFGDESSIGTSSKAFANLAKEESGAFLRFVIQFHSLFAAPIMSYMGDLATFMQSATAFMQSLGVDGEVHVEEGEGERGVASISINPLATRRFLHMFAIDGRRRATHSVGKSNAVYTTGMLPRVLGIAEDDTLAPSSFPNAMGESSFSSPSLLLIDETLDETVAAFCGRLVADESPADCFWIPFSFRKIKESADGKEEREVVLLMDESESEEVGGGRGGAQSLRTTSPATVVAVLRRLARHLLHGPRSDDFVDIKASAESGMYESDAEILSGDVGMSLDTVFDNSASDGLRIATLLSAMEPLLRGLLWESVTHFVGEGAGSSHTNCTDSYSILNVSTALFPCHREQRHPPSMPAVDSAANNKTHGKNGFVDTMTFKSLFEYDSSEERLAGEEMGGLLYVGNSSRRSTCVKARAFGKPTLITRNELSTAALSSLGYATTTNNANDIHISGQISPSLSNISLPLFVVGADENGLYSICRNIADVLVRLVDIATHCSAQSHNEDHRAEEKASEKAKQSETHVFSLEAKHALPATIAKLGELICEVVPSLCPTVGASFPSPFSGGYATLDLPRIESDRDHDNDTAIKENNNTCNTHKGVGNIHEVALYNAVLRLSRYDDDHDEAVAEEEEHLSGGGCVIPSFYTVKGRRDAPLSSTENNSAYDAVLRLIVNPLKVRTWADVCAAHYGLVTCMGATPFDITVGEFATASNELSDAIFNVCFPLHLLTLSSASSESICTPYSSSLPEPLTVQDVADVSLDFLAYTAHFVALHSNVQSGHINAFLSSIILNKAIHRHRKNNVGLLADHSPSSSASLSVGTLSSASTLASPCGARPSRASATNTTSTSTNTRGSSTLLTFTKAIRPELVTPPVIAIHTAAAGGAESTSVHKRTAVLSKKVSFETPYLKCRRVRLSHLFLLQQAVCSSNGSCGGSAAFYALHELQAARLNGGIAIGRRARCPRLHTCSGLDDKELVLASPPVEVAEVVNNSSLSAETARLGGESDRKALAVLWKPRNQSNDHNQQQQQYVDGDVHGTCLSSLEEENPPAPPQQVTAATKGLLTAAKEALGKGVAHLLLHHPHESDLIGTLRSFALSSEKKQRNKKNAEGADASSATIGGPTDAQPHSTSTTATPSTVKECFSDIFKTVREYRGEPLEESLSGEENSARSDQSTRGALSTLTSIYGLINSAVATVPSVPIVVPTTRVINVLSPSSSSTSSASASLLNHSLNYNALFTDLREDAFIDNIYTNDLHYGSWCTARGACVTLISLLNHPSVVSYLLTAPETHADRFHELFGRNLFETADVKIQVDGTVENGTREGTAGAGGHEASTSASGRRGRKDQGEEGEDDEGDTATASSSAAAGSGAKKYKTRIEMLYDHVLAPMTLYERRLEESSSVLFGVSSAAAKEKLLRCAPNRAEGGFALSPWLVVWYKFFLALAANAERRMVEADAHNNKVILDTAAAETMGKERAKVQNVSVGVGVPQDILHAIVDIVEELQTLCPYLERTTQEGAEKWQQRQQEAPLLAAASQQRSGPTIEEQFAAAQKAFGKAAEKYDNTIKLKFYGLFKQATVGDVNISRPWGVDVAGRAKYDAWAALKGMAKEDAVRRYIDEWGQLKSKSRF